MSVYVKCINVYVKWQFYFIMLRNLKDIADKLFKLSATPECEIIQIYLFINDVFFSVS